MIRINLLPHREEKRRARRQQFFALAGLVSVLASLIVLLVWSVINTAISKQEETNAFFEAEIATLDKQIVQIKALKQEIDLLKAKKNVVETLQRDRGRAVSLLNGIATQLPEGVYLKALSQNGLRVSLSGVSQSNSRVSEMMRSLEQSPVFERPNLVQTKATMSDRRKMQEFDMFVQMTPIATDGGK